MAKMCWHSFTIRCSKFIQFNWFQENFNILFIFFVCMLIWYNFIDPFQWIECPTSFIRFSYKITVKLKWNWKIFLSDFHNLISSWFFYHGNFCNKTGNTFSCLPLCRYWISECRQYSTWNEPRMLKVGQFQFIFFLLHIQRWSTCVCFDFKSECKRMRFCMVKRGSFHKIKNQFDM